MRPDEADLDEEIRGHLAVNIKERIAAIAASLMPATRASRVDVLQALRSE